MDNLKRFKAVCQGEKPDYIPIFSFPGAPGVSNGCMDTIHQKLIAQGLPESIPNRTEGGSAHWQEYWGTMVSIEPDPTPAPMPLEISFLPAEPHKGFECKTRIEGEYEIIESETGALTRQVINNDNTYSMPEFLVYDVRDRQSWKFYRDRATPGAMWPEEKIDDLYQRYQQRSKPLCIKIGSTWGTVRDLAGPERACILLYDDPDLVSDIIAWEHWLRRTYLFPVIEKLRPEIICCHEDNCYKQTMLISPRHFREFCSPIYQQICQFARDCKTEMIALDSDGNIMTLVALAAECGINAVYPCEVKAGNDLFQLRGQFPNFVFAGWLEKECLNEGNDDLIEKEIMSKVPALLSHGYYFPNIDHGIQPDVTFKNMCLFMTLLHDVLNNPEGSFPRIR